MNSDKKDDNVENQQKEEKFDTKNNVEQQAETQPDQNESDDINLTDETESQNETIPEPKKVERKIKHPKTDVVRYDEPELDSNWGWAIEFPSTETLTPVWDNLKSFLEKNDHPLKGKVSWLSLDPRGYFSPRIRHFIAFTGWGIQIEPLPDWFNKNISKITKPLKSIEASEELSEGSWQGYITKEKIDLNGSEFIKLDKFSRNKRKTVDEAKKPISSNVPRYWTQNALYTARDYLIPVITEEKFNAGELNSVSYLEEYIVEQLNWKEPENNKDEFVILPPEFTFDDNTSRKILIPEEYTPEINYDYPGMFPGMGGMGGLGDLAGMPDLGDMSDLDDSELDNLDLDDETQDELSENNDIEEDKEKDDAIDAEVVSDEK